MMDSINEAVQVQQDLHVLAKTWGDMAQEDSCFTPYQSHSTQNLTGKGQEGFLFAGYQSPKLALFHTRWYDESFILEC